MWIIVAVVAVVAVVTAISVTVIWLFTTESGDNRDHR